MDLILFSYIADFVFGDPYWFPHPVRLMGRLISILERTLNGSTHKTIQRFYGAVTVLGVIAISGVCVYAIIELVGKLHPIAGKIAWIFLAYTTLAIKDLVIHARAVWKRLSINDIEGARKKLSLMVGRDTEKLSQDEVIQATVETVAESTTDGIVSPLFYLFLGGPVLAVMFKAISTLDSMIGHKNERYLYFGWCAAKIDDIANFIPARITGLLIPIAALFSGKDSVQSLRIMFRDGKKQDSPNSAISEAAMSGALGVRLGGTCSYSGRIVKHPYLGEQRRPISISLIKEAITISEVSSLLMLAVGILFKQAVMHLICL
ncbi:MAG: adenosylcobinamide-phosphate synthase CbiB [Candidatus Omnitrophota bacterium]|nr:adenosylcobinamide-phosphate synthase CbiB [Candidatus Omnitrophota bacterium]